MVLELEPPHLTPTLDVAGGAEIDRLSIGGTYTFPTNVGTNGQVMTTNGAGVASWQNPASVDNIVDADGNTQIQVEESANEDIIRY